MRFSPVSLFVFVTLLALGFSSDAKASLAQSPPFVTNFAFVPDPPVSGSPFQLFLDLSKATQATTTVVVDFGDGTGPINLDGTGQKFVTTSKVYAADGGYTIQVNVMHNGFNIRTFIPVSVGPGVVTNPTNAAGLAITNASGVSSASVDSRDFAGGVVNAQAFISGGTATSATTEYEDLPGRSSINTGINTTHTYVDSGIFIVTTTVTGTTNVTFGGTGGKVRKTLAISSRDVGASNAPVDPPLKTVRVTKAGGKFIFSDNAKVDVVQFTGIVQLPAGFDPKRTDGNVFSVAAGNVSDTFTIDAKGKLVNTSTKSRVLKAQVKYPKLTGATATVGEEAAISVTYSIANLDTLGFDTEGITASPASGVESNQKAIRREIQFAVLTGGVAYTAKVNVEYKISKPKKGNFESDSGQFKLSRSSKK